MKPILLYTAGVLFGWYLNASFGQLAQCEVTDFDEQDRPTHYECPPIARAIKTSSLY
jgi:hypothetical protein